MNCNDISRCLDESSVASLSRAQAAAVEDHVFGCKRCAGQWRVAKQLLAFRSEVPQVPETLLDRAWQLDGLTDSSAPRRQSRRPWLVGSLALFGLASSAFIGLPWRSERAELAE
jgi:hypothetical protein